ncbi:hypothetical protein SAMN04487934_1126 [Eubacterium ruminantium]|nr:hypothetical protein SAMN04487934_1126 [Eubacterium ruminantium]
MDRYNERLVYGKPEGKTKVKLAIGMLIMAASFAVMMTITMLAFIIFVIAVVFFMKTFDWMNLEYEYTLTNGDIQIAKIAAAKTRKEVMTISLKDIKLLDSTFNDRVKNDIDRHEKLEILDFTEQVKDEEYYAVYVNSTGNGLDKLVILDLDENCLEHMKYYLKSKFAIKEIKKTEKAEQSEN